MIQIRHLCRQNTLLVAALACLAAARTDARIVYVNLSAKGPAHNGATWDSAYQTMNSAVVAAQPGDEIWVAKGVYYVNLFIGVGGIGLYGGFAGTETSRDQRDYRNNITVMTTGSITDQASGADAVTISGFTFQGIGTGFYIDASLAIISDNVFTGNLGAYPGIVLYILGSATVTNNIIYGNTQLGTGIIDIEQFGDAVISNNIIVGNTTTNGAAIYVLGTATITNNLIANNSALSNGAGINVQGSGTATISNNTIVGNNISSGPYKGEGAGIYAGGTATIVNNIVAFNSSGIFSAIPGIAVTNTDIYGNSDYDVNGFANPAGTYGNIALDPLFQTSTDYSLQPGSPCINAGTDTVVASGDKDLNGNARVYGGHVDMGAYEYTPPKPFSLTDVTHAMRMWAGLSRASRTEVSRLNVERSGNSAIVVDGLDCLRIARKVAGLEPNP